MLLTRARPATLAQRRSPGVTHGALITEPFYSEPSRAACSNREITECWESAVQAGGFGPAWLPTPASVAPRLRLNYKAFICHTTRLLLDVAPHVSLCAVCARACASQRPTPPPTLLKLQLKRLVDRSGRFSRVITSCAFLSRNWNRRLDTAKILRNIECRTCFFKKKSKQKKTDEVNSFLVPDH